MKMKTIYLFITLFLIGVIISFVIIFIFFIQESRQGPEMWIDGVEHGIASFNPVVGYQVYRNVMDFGCAGDGTRDDTACINTGKTILPILSKLNIDKQILKNLKFLNSHFQWRSMRSRLWIFYDSTSFGLFPLWNLRH